MPPRERFAQRLVRAQLHISPHPDGLRWPHDDLGNSVAVALFDMRAKALRMVNEMTLDHAPLERDQIDMENYARQFSSYAWEDVSDLLRSIKSLVRVAVARDPYQAVPLSASWSGLSASYVGMAVIVEVKLGTEADGDNPRRSGGNQKPECRQQDEFGNVLIRAGYEICFETASPDANDGDAQHPSDAPQGHTYSAADRDLSGYPYI